jgi:hypothetical protein
MKRLVHNEVLMKDNSVISGRQEHRVNLTHLLNDLTPKLIKCKILDTLSAEKGRLEIKDKTVILCFWNLQDKEEFLVNLQ